MSGCSLGRIHSIQSLGTVDGPGLRSVVFFQGCSLRCLCCHNPDTWDPKGGMEITSAELTQKLLRFAPYWREGGVTVSGGEPLLQAAFAAELFERLQENGVHTALDTSGCLWNKDAERLLQVTDLVLLDIKRTTPEEYSPFTGGDLKAPLVFLRELGKRKKPTWIRHVVIPGVTDGEENLRRLAELLEPFPCVEKLELLPFRKLCLEKYDAMGIPFPLADTPEATGESIEQAYHFIAGIPAERDSR